jgi:dTDP-4-dehydrorhamnose 3,5-epimerase
VAEFVKSKIEGAFIIQPQVYHDERGYFFESYNEIEYFNYILKSDSSKVTATSIHPVKWVQDNQSFSIEGVLRGLHIQTSRPQNKLIRVMQGKIWDVIVDLRSPEKLEWQAFELSAENRNQLFIPWWCAHGFLALEESVVLYKVDEHRMAEHEVTIMWDDPTVKIDWPLKPGWPVVSEKDENGISYQTFSEKFHE